MLRFGQIIGVMSLTAGAAMPFSADADVISVATDIAPIHSLVAMVMEGVDAPDLLIPAQASPHGYAMRPSEARALAGADVVFWVGPELTPWLEGPIASLAANSKVVTLAESDGLLVLPFREDVEFRVEDHDDHDGDDHNDDHDGEHDDDHDDHHGDKHDEHHDGEHEAKHDDDHGEDHGEDEHHHHHHAGGIDPHLWLDPQNAAIWLDQIAEVLSEVEPENAATFKSNAERGKEILDRTEREISLLLQDEDRSPYILTHDAYQYFENRFGLAPLGAINNGDAEDAGAARMSEIRDRVGAQQSLCAFTEPQYNEGLITSVTQGVETRVSVLDPLGVGLSTGPELYPNLLSAMGTSFANCLIAK